MWPRGAAGADRQAIERASGFLLFLCRGKGGHVDQERERQQKQTFMLRLGIESAGEDQHKKRAYCDGESAHSFPRSNLRLLLIARRVAIAARVAPGRFPGHFM